MTDAIDLAFTLFEILGVLEGEDSAAVSRSRSFWLTQDKSVIEMRMCGSELCGYLASDVDTGDPKISSCGLPVILGLKPENARKWQEGWLVDPDTGWAFNAKAKFKKNGTLKISIYDTSEIFNETLKWRQVTKEKASCYKKKQNKQSRTNDPEH